MLRRIVRALAVAAVALSPVWGYSSVQAGRALTPYWPSFDSVGCNALGQSFGGVVISCGTGGYVTTQITSAYGGCSQVDIEVNGFGSGPWYTTATAPVAGLQSTVNINDSGDYYMQLSWVPSTIVGPIQIQFSAPDTGNMSVQNITVNPCPVPPTATPVPPTNTPNPSDTATSTATAGPSHTPTPIPTNTPLPSGHNTFTPTNTTTPRPTGTATATPVPAEVNCGTSDFPLLNCTWLNQSGVYPAPDHWVSGWDPGITAVFCYDAVSSGTGFQEAEASPGEGAGYRDNCSQSVVAHATGEAFIQYQALWDTGTHNWAFDAFDSGGSHVWSVIDGSGATCSVGSSGFCLIDYGHVNAGTTYTVGVGEQGTGTNQLKIIITGAWVVPAAGTTTPTSTATPGPTDAPTATQPPGTATEAARETLTAVASSFTPTTIPIPGQTESPIPTDTPCPGGCAVTKLTAVPGLGTVTTVDTSPFSPLAHLSLSRSSCQPFGYAQIPVPVIHGTPALGSTTPLSVTWTVPVTGAWTNYNSDGTLNISNTAIQPCAMSEIPTFVWDLTYWLSVLMCAVAWFLWLIGFVGRLSGEETING